MWPSLDLISFLYTNNFSKKADLLGDDLSAPSEQVVSVPGGQKTNEDLLAEIFGGSSATSPAAPTSPSQPQRTTASDILSLFDSPAPTQAASPAVSSLFDLTSAVTPTSASVHTPAPAAAAAPPPKPAAPKLQSYNAYNKNDLVISLTPQRSATQKGVVDILARFQVTGSSIASGINFQVAVPKVSSNNGRLPTQAMTYLC
jgi:AP-1 complex subunit gamma-1